ncbi:sensor histidine kinase [Paenibacillus sp. USHLN196]|uniref:sensor histidine kinase n=1 Tax=Paenibacillus sp. USHLN196 TaxID=3081291 RepID=UPI0030190279
MKSELIANVSHDLKTPVTSLVSYIDLLKREEGTEEEKVGYIQVLERKTQRLCLLVEDLFEAAKMASGDVELHLKQIDIGELLRQAVAEYSDSFEQAELQIRMREESEPVYAMVDGSRMWRVMENVLGNVLKYGLPQSRVYIELVEQGNQLEFKIKNVSAYEMEFSSDEIFERFKRGDRSRSTEGSGLGLSIARSIVELHEGSMRIQVDGDVFQVSVCLPRADRNMIKNTTPLAMSSSF